MKILIVRFSSIGDVILTTGVINQLKKHSPNCEIHYLTLHQNLQLLQQCSFIDKIITIDKKESFLGLFFKFFKIGFTYSYIFDLHSNFRSLIFKMSHPFKTTSYSKNALSRRLFVSLKYKFSSLDHHVVQKYYTPIQRKLNLPNSSLEKLRPAISLIKPDQFDFDVVIHPFASKNTKVWPYFEELIEILKKNNYRVAIIGNGPFKDIQGITHFENKTSLDEVLKIINQSKLLVSNDSGPLHMGIAVNTFTVGIFGSTTKEFGFYPYFKHCRIVEHDNLNCRPCHVHGLDQCPLGHFNCMKDISVTRVFDEIKRSVPTTPSNPP
ncbi:MAG: glycosyltransferase family 9 protein [Bdellovibrionales bacterium]|nr:glycosyltransferase family 9 protein [Bdellovibrionales bacterium]